MRVKYKSIEESKGLRLASTYHPPQVNSVNDVSNNLVMYHKTKFKPLDEIKKEAEISK